MTAPTPARRPRSFAELKRLADAHNRNHALTIDGEDWGEWRKYPYTLIKQRINLDLSCALAYLLQHTKVQPNNVTLLYALCGPLGGLLLATGNPVAIVAGLVIFFFKAVLDWTDGLLARITGRCSDEGAVLDEWGSLVGSIGFLIGLGFYLLNRTHQQIYVFMMAWILLVRAIDIRHLTYLFLAYRLTTEGGVTRPLADLSSGVLNQTVAGRAGLPGWTSRLRWLVVNGLDDRARSVDFVCAVILLEVVMDRVVLTPVLYGLYVLKFTAIFVGGLYVVCIGKLPTRLNATVSALAPGHASR